MQNCEQENKSYIKPRADKFIEMKNKWSFEITEVGKFKKKKYAADLLRII